MKLIMSENKKKALFFIGLTFFFSWLIAILFYVSGGRLNMPAATAVLVLYMFVPMTVAITVQKFVYREPVKDLGISWKLNRWFLVAWLLPAGIAFATLGVSLLFPGVEYSPEMAGLFERFESVLTPEQMEVLKTQFAASPIHPIWIALFQGLVAGITIIVITGGNDLIIGITGLAGFIVLEFINISIYAGKQR